MTIGFVLGNGKSRLAIDPKELMSKGSVYACNAIYREFIPHVLIATDRLIAQRIQDEGVDKKVKFWTRRPAPESSALKIERPYFGMSSGPVAVSRSCINGDSTIYLVGFDLGSTNDKFNNVYADTEFYKKSDDPPTFAGNWVYQLHQIAKEFKNTRLFRVTGPESADIEWNEDNISNISMDDFKAVINKL